MVTTASHLTHTQCWIIRASEVEYMTWGAYDRECLFSICLYHQNRSEGIDSKQQYEMDDKSNQGTLLLV